MKLRLGLFGRSACRAIGTMSFEPPTVAQTRQGFRVWPAAQTDGQESRIRPGHSFRTKSRYKSVRGPPRRHFFDPLATPSPPMPGRDIGWRVPSSYLSVGEMLTQEGAQRVMEGNPKFDASQDIPDRPASSGWWRIGSISILKFSVLSMIPHAGPCHARRRLLGSRPCCRRSGISAALARSASSGTILGLL
jgi:hypothetical protein